VRPHARAHRKHDGHRKGGQQEHRYGEPGHGGERFGYGGYHKGVERIATGQLAGG
jgi:hypothetical protein